jgi:3-phenylpropionate/trans-cinnamate dioxygenase ferredoxin reductase component
MAQYKYLIIGGGMTADSAVQGIRQVDAEGSIGLIGSDTHPPYNRPPLTKQLWKGKPFESIWRGTDKQNVTLHLGRTVQSLDPKSKSVTDDQGNTHTYEKLLLATGGSPHQLPFGADYIIYYRTVDDYQKLRALTEQSERFAVIGGGFIGSEIAAALAMNGKQVVMAFPEKGIGDRVFPYALSQYINGYYREKGVEVLTEQFVTGLETRGKQLALKTGKQSEVVVDAVIAGIGIRPNTELADAANLKVDNGIVVDEFLRTSHTDIYAAGDVASFYSTALGMRMRVEHEDNANTMGKMAGQNMAGQAVPYHHLPFFYSDLFDLGYEAVGNLDSHLETFVDWMEPNQKGVIYYLQDSRVVGVLLWNVWDQVEAARKLIQEPGPFKGADLKGRLPA